MGSSTVIWPRVMATPAWRERMPAASVATVIGPGAMMAERDMPTAVTINANIQFSKFGKVSYYFPSTNKI